MNSVSGFLAYLKTDFDIDLLQDKELMRISITILVWQMT